MKFSNMIKKIALVLLLPVSITNLPADTNPYELQTEQISAPANNTADEMLSPENALLQICKAFAGDIEDMIGLIFSLKSGQGKSLVSAITPILTYSEGIKNLSDTATPGQLHYTCQLLNECVTHLHKILETGADQNQDFLPQIATTENPSLDELLKSYNQLETNWNQLVKKVEESRHDVWRNLRMHVNNQLNKLDKILQDINTNISTNDSIVGKEEIKKDIMDLRTTLRHIQKELASAGPNPQAIMGIYQVNQAIISYLQECQKHKFRKWALLDLAGQLMRKTDSGEKTLDELMYDMYKTNAELEKLEKDAEKIDLTVVNHAARFLGDYVVDPIQRHNLALWGAAAIASVGLGTYAAYYFDQKFFPQPDSWFRKMFGYRNHAAGKVIGDLNSKAGADALAVLAKILGISQTDIHDKIEQYAEALKSNKDAKVISQADQLSAMDRARTFKYLLNIENRNMCQPTLPIGTIDEFINDNKSGTAAIGISLIGLASYSYYQIWKQYNKLWAEKIYVWFTKLKGGSYTKTAEKWDEIIPTITFDDVIGFEHEKSQVYPHLKYIKDPESWDAQGKTPPTGILLTGDTRTGKTFFAKAICGEIHKQNPEKTIKFISIDAHDIKAEGIAMWMKVAKMMAPCVLFIDEIDLLNLQRTGDRTLLADFLKEMSGIADKDPKKQVIVIGTTNKPENLDHALRQSGRFALVIPFSYPNLKDRITFINKRLEAFAIDPKAFDIDVNHLAYETNGRSFEDLKLMLDIAFIRTDIKGEAITQEHLEWALDTQLRKIIDIDTKDVATDEKRSIAAHFAGQALSHMLLDLNEKIAKVTIRQIVVKAKEEATSESLKSDHKKQAHVQSGGLFTYLEHDSYDINNAAQLEKKAKTYLAARVAERIITGTSSTVLGYKKNDAFNLLKSIVADGIDLKSLSKEGQNKISDETLALLKSYEREMEQLLYAHKETLVALTNALQEQQTLTFAQIKSIVTNAQSQFVDDSNPVAIPA